MVIVVGARTRGATGCKNGVRHQHCIACGPCGREDLDARLVPDPVLARPEVVIFDFNGTVSDDEPILAGFYPEIFAGAGVEFPADRYYAELAGYSDPEIIELVRRMAGRFDGPWRR